MPLLMKGVFCKQYCTIGHCSVNRESIWSARRGIHWQTIAIIISQIFISIINYFVFWREYHGMHPLHDEYTICYNSIIEHLTNRQLSSVISLPMWNIFVLMPINRDMQYLVDHWYTREAAEWQVYKFYTTHVIVTKEDLYLLTCLLDK